MAQPKYEIAAYYFPQYHTDPRNDRWHGKGWTEWELLRAARPRYAGHRQPIVPAWGYFDEAEPAWTEKQIDLAADYGVTSFIFDWYWYEDGPFLERALEQGFLRAANRDRLRFGLMWANHDWMNIHPATFVRRPWVLAPGRVSAEAFDRLTDHVVRTYFSQPNFLTIDGAPYFSIYEVGTFIASMGGIDAARRVLDRFRAKTRQAGHPDLHLNFSIWQVGVLPGESKPVDAAQVVRELSAQSTGSYCWVHHYDPNTAGFPRGSYTDAAERNYGVWDSKHRELPIPYHPNVSMGWDSSPRTIQSDVYERCGYPWTAILDGNTPEAFGAALRRAKAFLDQADVRQKVLTINAWNEWTEGSYLLPDTVYGTAYLQAIRDVFA